MVRGADGKWRTMANEALYRRQKLIGMVYRSELAQGLARLGYEIEKSHADGRFEIAGVPRDVIDVFSTRRTEIETAMEVRGLDARTVVADSLSREAGGEQAAVREADGVGREAVASVHAVGKADPAGADGATKAAETVAVDWAVAHLAERETLRLMRDGQGRGQSVMRSWMVSARLHRGPLIFGGQDAERRGRHRRRNAADVPRPQRRRCRGASLEQG